MPYLNFNIDPKHSQIHFELDHLAGLSLLTSRISGLQGPLLWDEESGSLSFDASADTRTVSSALPTLDALLPSHDMFDTKSHPTIRLNVRPFSCNKEQSTAQGTLTIRGLAVDTEVSIISVRTVVHPRGYNVVGVRASLSVLRSGFGMAVQKNPTLKDETRFVFNIEATNEAVSVSRSG